MYLAAAEQRLDLLEKETDGAPCSARWEEFPFSVLSHHGEACCDIAREWVKAMDYAQLNGGDLLSGPRWLRQRYEWGPSVWPLHWCEAVNEKVIDCGAHAALAHEAFEARGVTAFRAQFVQSYSPEAIGQWRTKWVEGEASDHWLDDEFIYHEGNALLAGGDEVKLWDGSAGCWVNPRQSGGYGSLMAVRIFADEAQASAGGFRWGLHRIAPNHWHHIG
ncbi:MAG TPA: hypothetical protein VGR19_12775 [Allosphingosinicella sp.]|nr:hypothetical protein [Allosphingosinicella sp.]